MLTPQRLREILSYDPETGIWTWRVQLSRRVAIGARAGGNKGRGYWGIRIGGRDYKSYRLAWLYMTGAWPENEVDHENGVKNDDRWSNLREATHSQNACNRGVSSANTSGFKGVSWAKRERRWVANIKIDRRQMCLGYFKDIHSASAAYCAAAQRVHGEFART